MSAPVIVEADNYASRNGFVLAQELGLDSAEFRSSLLSKVLESNVNVAAYYQMRRDAYTRLVRENIKVAFTQSMDWLMSGRMPVIGGERQKDITFATGPRLVPATPESVARPICYQHCAALGKLWSELIDSILPPDHTHLANAIRQKQLNADSRIDF